MLWSSRLLILLVLMARFPWNMLRPQLHLLSLTVKTPMLGGLCISHCEQKTSNFRCTPSFYLLPDKVSKRVSIIRRVIYYRFDCSSQARQDFPSDHRFKEAQPLSWGSIIQNGNSVLDHSSTPASGIDRQHRFEGCLPSHLGPSQHLEILPVHDIRKDLSIQSASIWAIDGTKSSSKHWPR